MTAFQRYDNAFKRGKMSVFNDDTEGLLWLKLKSIIRKDFVSDFVQRNGIVLKSSGLANTFAELFAALISNVAVANAMLDAFIREVSAQQIARVDIKKLVSELYKLRTFDWGGDYQNALDKYLVSRYVKTDNPSFESLLSRFDSEINPAVRGYVLNSWFNYWSSVLIENIFKQHPSVLPTIGKVKSVDFFVKGIPFDLKVTYFPSEYLASERKIRRHPVAFTFLKQRARVSGIPFDTSAASDVIENEIREKMRDRNDAFCKKTLQTLHEQNMEILDEAIKNPKRLAQWLYEHQGEMRFGAENRIYLVLVDTADFQNAWKIKRNVDLLGPAITQYLDSFVIDTIRKKQIAFTFKGKTGTFSALADVIFVVKQYAENLFDKGNG